MGGPQVRSSPFGVHQDLLVLLGIETLSFCCADRSPDGIPSALVLVIHAVGSDVLRWRQGNIWYFALAELEGTGVFIEPIPDLNHRLTDKFFGHSPLHPNPLVQQIGNYTLADLTNLYKKYKHKRRSI
jgi:hypothetical protein